MQSMTPRFGTGLATNMFCSSASLLSHNGLLAAPSTPLAARPPSPR
eukprot:CAMPEP_0174919094 /NCGR_PEP_ID=MMETSP1355-20121228/3473_1 /TAXON_ID=464990 /ORGANISM="Hemiselmis tepida, Strain CCMP443" /LENGTH=45 /DNA_ID= /DNA_START= /DNA_END= /DNA_ORIENTATION=